MTIPLGGALDPEQHMVVIKTAEQWKTQALDGLARIEAASGGQLPDRFADADKIDHQAFAQVVEALVALEPLTHKRVSADLIAMAGLVPVDQALME